MAAEVEVKETPIEELSQEEYKAARVKGVTTIEKPVEKKDEADEQRQEDEKPKPKGGFQKRIDRLIRQNAALEEQLAAERQRKAAEAGGKQQEQRVEGDPEPKRDAFQDDPSYYRALAKWEVRQEMKAEKEREQRELAAAEEKSRNDAYNKRVSEAKAKHDDWLEVVNQPIIVPNAVVEAIKEMDNGPEVAYFLGNHPEVCEELMEMSQSRASGMIWRISEKLEGETKDEDEEETEETEEKPPAKAKEEEKPERKKYEPIKPVGGSSKSSVPLDKMSMADYKKARAAGRLR
jgi:hypothetical protein